MITHDWMLDGRLVKVQTKHQSTPLTEFDKRFLEQYVAKNIDAVRQSWTPKHWCSECPADEAKRQVHREKEFWKAVAAGLVFKV